MILPLPPAYALETLTEATLLGGTAAQATALSKSPAFAGWTVVGESWAVTDKPPAGYKPQDPTAIQAIWDASGTLSLRTADLAGTMGTLPVARTPAPLPLGGLDPSLGLQLRFRREYRVVQCPSSLEAQEVVDAAYGPRRAPYGTVARWDAAAQSEGWGTPVCSTTWPKP